MGCFVVHLELSRISATSTQVQTSKYKPSGLPTMSNAVLTHLRVLRTPLHPSSDVFPYSPPHKSRREPIARGSKIREALCRRRHLSWALTGGYWGEKTFQEEATTQKV